MQRLFSPFKTLRIRFFLALLIVGIVPFSLAGIFMISNESRALTRQSERELKGLARGLADELDTYVNELLQDSQIIATLPDIVSMDIEQQQPILEDMYAYYDRYGQLALIDLTGQIYATGREMELITINHIPSYQVAKTGKQAWVVAPHLFNKDVLVLHMHTPIKDSNEETIGVLGSPTSLGRLTALLEDLQIGNGQAFVLDEKGDVLLHPIPEVRDARENYLDRITLPENLDQFFEGTASYISGENRQLSGYATIPNLGWTVVVERPEADVLAPVVDARNVALLGLLGAILLSLLIAVLFSRVLTRQLGEIQALFDHVRGGDYAARVEIVSDDELGQMAEDLNGVLDDTLVLVQSQEERDRLQDSILKLVTEVSDVAEGDLTVEAEVTPEITGAIADSFNFMIYQLREVISGVQETAYHVTSSAQKIQLATEGLAQGSELQAIQITDASHDIQNMAVSMQQVSTNAERSAMVAQDARSNAQLGAQAVMDTIKGMNRIQGQVETTSRRITSLGESSQEIGDIVRVIDDIADRTSILALNASIQAAAAGEAGDGFAVLAAEIKELAQQAVRSTTQIGALIRTVQADINEAVYAMEESSREVGRGSRLANEAGRTLAEIERVSYELADLIRIISNATRDQAGQTESVASIIGAIAKVTQQTADGTRQTAGSIDDLAKLADQLRASVSAFKLPSRNGRAKLLG